MVFTGTDKSVGTIICTLASLFKQEAHFEEKIVFVGQQMGMSREDILLTIEEFDKDDLIQLISNERKKSFLSTCFPNGQGDEFYAQVKEKLGLR